MATQENIPPSLRNQCLSVSPKIRSMLKDVLDPQGCLHSNPIVISRVYRIVHKGESAPVLDVVAKREKGFVRVFTCIARVFGGLILTSFPVAELRSKQRRWRRPRRSRTRRRSPVSFCFLEAHRGKPSGRNRVREMPERLTCQPRVASLL